MSQQSDSLTQKWLRQNIAQYLYQDRVYSDVNSALARYLTLRPKSDVYSQLFCGYHSPHKLSSDLTIAYDDGRSQLLICLHGLLPISFRGAPYNIPIALWLVREHPVLQPIVYVVPTNDMLVRAGKYVDTSGRISIDYIQHWERKHEVRLR
jgi:ESCRT-I complex subunit TSG101